MIKAGVVAVNRFVRSGSREFASYIDYLDRNEAVRNENFKDFNLFNDYMDQPEKSTGIFTDKKSILTDADKKNLKNLFQIAYENHSLMWQTVISFDNKWLQEHGVYNAKTGVLDEEKMKELTRGAVNSLLESENLSNAVWTASFHFNTDNIHVHVATVEPQPMRKQKEYIQYQYIGNPEGEYVKLSNGEFVKSNSRNYLNRYGVPLLRYDRVPIYENGKILRKKEYVGRFKLSNLNAAKKYIADQISVDKENNILINKIIRDQIVKSKKQINIFEDHDMAKQFIKLHKELPRNVDRGLWKYNSNVMKPLRQEIDKLSDIYMQKYHAADLLELKKLLIKQSSVFHEAYGDTGRDFYENKMQELHERLGNAILNELRSYDKNTTIPMEIDDNLNLNEEIEMEIDDNLNLNEEVEMEIDDNLNLNEKVEMEIDDNLNLNEKVEMEIDDNLNLNEKVEMETKFEAESADQKAYRISDFSFRETGENRYARRKRVVSEKGYFIEWNNDFKDARKKIYGKKKNYKKAFEILLEQSDTNILATYELGNIYKYGRGVDIDLKTSETFFQKAFEMFQDLEASIEYENPDHEFLKEYVNYRIGKHFDYGLGVDQDYDKAKKFYEKSESALSDFSLGNLYFCGNGVEKDLERAFQYYMRSDIKKRDNGYVQYKIATMYEKGMGIEENSDKAEKYYRMAFKSFNQMLKESEDDNIQYRVGMMLINGKGVEKDLKKGIEFLEASAENGNPNAQYQIAKIYLDSGEGDPVKINAAIKYLENVANKGKNSMAHYQLGKLYIDKQFLYFNAKKGIEHLQIAADQNNEYAQFRLGILYLQGRIVTRNLRIAEKYLTQSAENGNEYAADVLKQLKENRFKLKGKPYVMRSLKVSIGNLKSVLKSEKEKAFNMKIYKENERNAEMNAKKEQESEVL